MSVSHVEIDSEITSILLSLYDGKIHCHFLPDLRKVEADLDADQIIDFEPYMCPKGTVMIHLLAALTKSLEIMVYAFDKENFTYKYISFFKISAMPIFDGGITVYKNVFLIQYENSAEYIRIHNMGGAEAETRFKLWDFTEEEDSLMLMNDY